MRIPVGNNLESRDGTLAKGALIKNGMVEVSGQNTRLRKRPGLSDLGLVKAGVAQLLYAWNGVKTVQDDFINSGTLSTIVSSPTSTDLTPTSADLQFSGQETGPSAGTPLLMIKNQLQAWSVNRTGTPTAITLPSGLGSYTYSVLTLTRSGATATATLTTDPDLNVGDSVVIAGAADALYNGTKTVTAVTPGSFTPAQDVALVLTRAGSTVTATTVSGNHELIDATSYTISGATQTEYNGSFTITVTSPTTFTYTLPAFTTPATGTILPNAHYEVMAFSNSGTGDYTLFNVSPISAGLQTFVNGESVYLFADGVARTVVNSTGTSFQLYNTSIASPYSGALIATKVTQPTITSVTSSGFTATVTTSAAHNFATGVELDITGATPTAYNATQVSITKTGANTFTYTIPNPVSPATGSPVVTRPAVTVNTTFEYAVGGAPATPAAGTITATIQGGTVPGIAYINGYFCIMDTNAKIYNSDSDDPTTWNSLNVITAENEAGNGMGIGRSLEYLIAFKDFTTEPFYDAKNPVGSPFLPVSNLYFKIGCATGDSIAEVDNTIIWVSQTRQEGRSVHALTGLEPTKISTPDIDRILNADSLSGVYAYGLKLDGHSLYLLTLVNTNVTLVFDLTTQIWYSWTSMTLGTPLSFTVASLTSTNGVATWISDAPHRMQTGDLVSISGIAQDAYNGSFQITYVNNNSFSYSVPVGTVSPATAAGTIDVIPYSESYFKFTKYVDYEGTNLFLHESNGHLYSMSSQLYQDAGLPITYSSRSQKLDGGSSNIKTMRRLVLVGDQVADTAFVRWSDDDYQTYSTFRVVDLSKDLPQILRLGAFRRRALEIKHIGNTAPKWDAIELEVA